MIYVLLLVGVPFLVAYRLAHWMGVEALSERVGLSAFAVVGFWFLVAFIASRGDPPPESPCKGLPEPYWTECEREEALNEMGQDRERSGWGY